MACRIVVSLGLLLGAAAASGYDAAQVAACRELKESEVDGATYERCCCARCDCAAIPQCANQCAAGRTKLEEIRRAEALRDALRQTQTPPVSPGR
jgi:hypothetical protein